ncbi:hypothetical protein R1flu_022117 [Riccia fluitans]|uniref:Uncharacterized protein n=1 Tax=Riccia fluitans TaxID=41844 RepID=A0ABD1ZUD9_9MARC
MAPYLLIRKRPLTIAYAFLRLVRAVFKQPGHQSIYHEHHLIKWHEASTYRRFRLRASGLSSWVTMSNPDRMHGRSSWPEFPIPGLAAERSRSMQRNEERIPQSNVASMSKPSGLEVPCVQGALGSASCGTKRRNLQAAQLQLSLQAIAYAIASGEAGLRKKLASWGQASNLALEDCLSSKPIALAFIQLRGHIALGWGPEADSLLMIFVKWSLVP